MLPVESSQRYTSNAARPRISLRWRDVTYQVNYLQAPRSTQAGLATSLGAIHEPMFIQSPVTIGPAMAAMRKPLASSFKRIALRHGARCITSATDAAQHVLHKFEGQTKTYRQILDGHQVQKLSLTLNRRHLYPGLDVSFEPPPPGTPLPPGYHLAYFLPAAVEDDLGTDGTDKTFNAPAPFSRRMWAGGEMSWVKGVPLRVGEEVEERTRLVAASAKKSRNGSEMVLVVVEKEFWGPNGLALVDKRSWIFRPPPTEALSRAEENTAPIIAGAVGKSSTVEDVSVEGSGELFLLRHKSSVYISCLLLADIPQRKLAWSPVALFRFSALTFNAHMIHYNEGWTRNVEGHPAAVVHGPLNLIVIMYVPFPPHDSADTTPLQPCKAVLIQHRDYWRDIHSGGQQPRIVTYRALSPVYTGYEYYI